MSKKINHSIKRLSLVSLSIASFTLTSNAWAVPYTVNSTNDVNDGVCDATHCSLREAIIAANTSCSGNDEIRFNIATSNASSGTINYYSIQPTTNYPAIVCPVKIDGFTQLGAGPGAPLIELNGSLLPLVTTSDSALLLLGRNLTSGLPLATNANGSTIRGLIINKFPSEAIRLFGVDNATIIGNFIGLDVTGEKATYHNGRLTPPAPPPGFLFGGAPQVAIRLEGSSNNYIGTTLADYNLDTYDSANRNIIGAHRGRALSIDELRRGSVRIGSTDNIVQGNYVGLNKTGSRTIGGFTAAGTPADPAINPLATASFVSLGLIIFPGPDLVTPALNTDNVVGGLKPGQGNVISTGTIGMETDGPRTQVLGNFFGCNPDGTSIANNNGNNLGALFVLSQALYTNIEGNTIVNTRRLTAGTTVAPGIGLKIGTFRWTPGASNIVVKNNYIGTNKARTLLGGNQGAGVAVMGTPLNGNHIIENNVIANNDEGIILNVFSNLPVAPVLAPSGVSILSNIIYANIGLGIDINPTIVTSPIPGIEAHFFMRGDGPTLNDSIGHSSNVPNHGQNFPVLDAARSFENPALVQVEGDLDSASNSNYLIQVFSNNTAVCKQLHISPVPPGYQPSAGCTVDAGFTTAFLAAQGQVLIGQIQVLTDGNGHTHFRFPAKLNAPVGSLITSTATLLNVMPDGSLKPSDTSEFSQAIDVDKKGSLNGYVHADGAAGGENGQGTGSDPCADEFSIESLSGLCGLGS